MTRETITLAVAITGAICGVTGAVLGIINAWHQLQRNKVRLKVIPSTVRTVGVVCDLPLNFGIEVINLSDFPVVIADVGFRSFDRCFATLATIQGVESNGTLPLRLEPHSSYSKIFHVDDSTTDWGRVKCAYARTECGALITGTSGALKHVIKQAAGQDG